MAAARQLQLVIIFDPNVEGCLLLFINHHHRHVRLINNDIPHCIQYKSTVQLITVYKQNTVEMKLQLS